jgi:hypothetical protein
MPFTGILDPGQLAIITAVLDEYCRQAGIATDHPEREALAHRVLTFIALGVRSPGELMDELRKR